MEDIILKITLLVQTSAIGLGVGCSTLAIASFLTALYDNQIDASERRMLGVIYTNLRVAMALMLVTTVIIQLIAPELYGQFAYYLGILIAVLFINAYAMTKHWIPSKFGPAIQAGTWYTLGFILTIYMFDLFATDWTAFWLWYGVDLIVAYIVVNGFMAWRKRAVAAKGETA